MALLIRGASGWGKSRPVSSVLAPCKLLPLPKPCLFSNEDFLLVTVCNLPFFLLFVYVCLACTLVLFASLLIFFFFNFWVG